MGIAAAAGFLLLTLAVWAGWTADADAAVSAELTRSPLSEVLGFLTHAGDPPILAALCVIVVVVLWRWGRFDEARVVLGSVLIAAVARWAILPVVGRIRPDTSYAENLGFSYPSGHAVYSCTAALILLYLSRKTIASYALVLCWPAIVGVSRSVLGAHWPSDVLGGWLLAAAVVAATGLEPTTQLTAWREQRSGPRRTSDNRLFR